MATEPGIPRLAGSCRKLWLLPGAGSDAEVLEARPGIVISGHVTVQSDGRRQIPSSRL